MTHLSLLHQFLQYVQMSILALLGPIRTRYTQVATLDHRYGIPNPLKTVRVTCDVIPPDF
jgi:hypothetical protein